MSETIEFTRNIIMVLGWPRLLVAVGLLTFDQRLPIAP